MTLRLVKLLFTLVCEWGSYFKRNGIYRMVWEQEKRVIEILSQSFWKRHVTI